MSELGKSSCGSPEHGINDSLMGMWVANYAARTPDCQAARDATWEMLDDSPQPDAHLIIKKEFGGHSRRGKYFSGAPELVAETCVSSRSYDLHQKLDLYLEAGVDEYVAVLVEEREIRWMRRAGRLFQPIKPGRDGIIHSRLFGGLWLDPNVVLACDGARVLDTLDLGLASPDHAAFCVKLERKRADWERSK